MKRKANTFTLWIAADMEQPNNRAQVRAYRHRPEIDVSGAFPSFHWTNQKLSKRFQVKPGQVRKVIVTLGELA